MIILLTKVNNRLTRCSSGLATTNLMRTLRTRHWLCRGRLPMVGAAAVLLTALLIISSRFGIGRWHEGQGIRATECTTSPREFRKFMPFLSGRPPSVWSLLFAILRIVALAFSHFLESNGDCAILVMSKLLIGPRDNSPSAPWYKSCSTFEG